MTRLEVTFNGTNTYIEEAILQNRQVVEVYLDGVGRSRILTSGTPTGQEALYLAATGRVAFPLVPEQGTQIVVLYQNL